MSGELIELYCTNDDRWTPESVRESVLKVYNTQAITNYVSKEHSSVMR